ncbi:GGDEF domain-containing protein [Dyella sp. ASV21]|uniref:GGDEF domain-containing protein n=1 Tax=Dyella sp. ASV21 TaxID=2795114 RepID=UPI0018EAD7DE|nr:GGDEF domain-containing protein [Dyella sp. ASV21]
MFRTASPDPSVETRFRGIVAAVYVSILCLMAWIFLHQWQSYRSAIDALGDFDAYRAALNAVTRLSAERGPAGAILGEELPLPAERIARLALVRQQSDASLRRLQELLETARCEHCTDELDTLQHVRTELSDARAQVDGLIRLPRSERGDAQVDAAIQRSGNMIPTLQSIAATSVIGALEGDPKVVTYLYTAAFATLLRERAGLAATYFIPALTAHRPLHSTEVLAIERTLGNISQLQMLVQSSVLRLQSLSNNAPTAANQHYFDNGVQLITDLLGKASETEEPGVTIGEFTDQMLPPLQAVTRLRDQALQLAEDSLRHNLFMRRVTLIATVLIGSILTAIVLFLVRQFHRQVILPFVEARAFVSAIAAGDFSHQPPARDYHGEIKDLFAALMLLRQSKEERLKLEKERDQLIRELRTMASTDPLTGLNNRRAFEHKAEALLAERRSPHPYVALIAFDIDHFKRINDTYGHETGDRALQRLAELCRETWREGDVIGRVGGEEFCTLTLIASPDEASVSAQRLRQRLHDERITAVDGRAFSMTASFGVSHASRQQAPALDALLRHADALLYRAKSSGRDRIETDPLSQAIRGSV